MSRAEAEQGPPIRSSWVRLPAAVDAGRALVADDDQLLWTTTSTRRIYRIDPADLAVASSTPVAVDPHDILPPGGATSLAVVRSSKEVFWASGAVYRLKPDGTVSDGPWKDPPVTDQGKCRFAWDDARGELHVIRSDASHRGVLVTDRSFAVLRSYGSAQIGVPLGIAVNAALDRVAVLERNRVLLFRASTHALTGSVAIDDHADRQDLALTNGGEIWLTHWNSVVRVGVDGNVKETFILSGGGDESPVIEASRGPVRSVTFHEGTGCAFATCALNHLDWVAGRLYRLHPSS